MAASEKAESPNSLLSIRHTQAAISVGDHRGSETVDQGVSRFYGLIGNHMRIRELDSRSFREKDFMKRKRQVSLFPVTCKARTGSTCFAPIGGH